MTRNVSHLFLSIKRDPFDVTSCRLATEALMEILGLVPSNPRRNTSKKEFECLLSGSKVVPKRLHGAALELFKFNGGRDYMAGKPYQSCLIPYENEILALRRRRPPVSFAQISELLRNEHQLSVCRQTVCKFLKVRARNTKMFGRRQNTLQENSLAVTPKPQPANTKTISPEKPIFEFTYSERYNLHRLPKEEAAAIRKKLEAEGP